MNSREKIDKYKADTDAALDRIISTASETNQVASLTKDKLVQQGEQIRRINHTLESADHDLDNTERKLKYGFGFKAFFMGGRADERPSKSTSETGGHVRRRSEPPPATNSMAKNAYIPNKNAPVGFDDKLDAIDRLLDEMGAAAQTINAELNAQSTDLDAVDSNISQVRNKTDAQCKTMVRKFGLR